MSSPRHKNTGESQRGVTLIMAVLTLSALLSISIGISVILFGQVILQQQGEYSFQALYAADTGMEKTFYRDRVLAECGSGACATAGFVPSPGTGNNSCYRVTVNTTSGCGGAGTSRCIVSTGQYRCGGSTRFVQRAFRAIY